MFWTAALPTAKMYEINEIILAVGPFALTFLILIVMHFLGVPLFPLSVFGKKVRRLPHYSKDKYLFSWDSVPGDDNEKLKRFLKDDFNIDWVENAEIRKSDDGMTINISKGENSAEIMMDENKEKAILKIRDGRTCDLNVKTKNDKRNIYYGENLTHKWNKKILSKLEQKDEIKVIYGECKDCTRIKTALERDLSVEAIIGDRIWKETSKERIMGLMEKYPEKLSIYISSERPERHAELLGHHFFLEDPHRYDEPYKSSIVVENASEELISHFKTRFEEMKEKAERATISDIQKMGVYRRNEDD